MRASDLPESEFHPYYKPYIDALGDDDLFLSLTNGLLVMENFINQLPEGKLDFSYGPDKWTIAEVLIHLIDTERIFQYRALRFYRNDKIELCGFDQDEYVIECEAAGKSKNQILQEYSTVRKATIALFQSFNKDALNRMGKASGTPMSVRALGLMISGHQKHHFKIIEERYLV